MRYEDKVYHFIVGALIMIIMSGVGFDHEVAMFCVVAAGFGKETYDRFTTGFWDWYDILWTFIGGAAADTIIRLTS
jgi:hypothetical protein